MFRALKTSPPVLCPDFMVQVKIHPRARGITLRYNHKSGGFTLTRPKRFSAAHIAEFLQQNRNWMEQQSRLAQAPRVISPGDMIAIAGKTRHIIHHEKPGVTITLTEDELILACRLSRFPRALSRYLQQRAAEIMIPLAHEKATAIGQTIPQITFRDTSSRWGSCARDGKLSFSWRLIMAPMEVIDYLVAHEVAHLQHFDHSRDFWALCRNLTPHATFGKHWLKLNGTELHRIIFQVKP